jgi:hypothetical protein
MQPTTDPQAPSPDDELLDDEELELEGQDPETPDDSPPASGSDSSAGLAAEASRTAQSRDERGRFAGQDGAPAALAGDPPAPPAATDPGAAPARPQAAPPGASPTGTAADWSFRADGQEIPIQGARYGEHGTLGTGLFIPEGALSAVRQTLAQGVAHQGSFRQRLGEMQRSIDEAKQQGADREAAATALLREIDAALASPDAFRSFVQDFAQNRAILVERAKAAQATARLQTYERREQASQTETQRAQLEEAKDQALEQAILSIVESPDLKPLFGQPQLEGVYQHLHGLRDALFRVAEQDYYDDAGTLVAQRGQLVIDLERVGQAMRREAQLIASSRRAAKAAEDVERQNQQALGGAGRIPPTPTGQRGAPPAEEAPVFKSRDEWQDYIASGGTRVPKR